MFTTRNRIAAAILLSTLCTVAGVAELVRETVPLRAATINGATSEIVVTATPMLAAKSALNAASVVGVSYMPQCRETAIYVDWGTGVASGAVQIETAVDSNYAGTWAPLQTVTFAASAPKQDVVQITGAHWAIRTRISTVLAGGTVNTWLVCN